MDTSPTNAIDKESSKWYVLNANVDADDSKVRGALWN